MSCTLTLPCAEPTSSTLASTQAELLMTHTGSVGPQSWVGVGMVIKGTKDHYGHYGSPFFVKSLAPERSADLSGKIECGDCILAVDGNKTEGLSLMQVNPSSSTVLPFLIST
jgi:C-terminal processing protease CtpA/Prc